jgi:hypothetical protein
MQADDYPYPSARRLCGRWLSGTGIHPAKPVERREAPAQDDDTRRKDGPPHRGRLPRHRGRPAPDPGGDDAAGDPR